MEEKERKELARDIAEMVVEKLTDVLENLLRPEARSNDDGDETQTTITETTTRTRESYLKLSAETMAGLMNAHAAHGFDGARKVAKLDKKNPETYVRKVKEELDRIERKKQRAELTGDIMSKDVFYITQS